LDVYGFSYGGQIAKWLSEVLEQPNLDLVSFDSDLEPRNLKQMNAQSGTPRDHDETIYADYSPFMMISEASLDELNKRLQKKVSMRSFRPNFTARGCLPFAEVFLSLLSKLTIRWNFSFLELEIATFLLEMIDLIKKLIRSLLNFPHYSVIY